MSTRGCIARPLGDVGFEGVYQHFDSYPTGLGPALWAIYHTHFKGNVEGMQKALIDDHPAGWSSIDFEDAKGDAASKAMTETAMVAAVVGHLVNDPDIVSIKTPHSRDLDTPVTFGTCYCHSRGEGVEGAGLMKWVKDRPDLWERIDPLFIEFVYVLHKQGMDIYTFYSIGKNKTETRSDGTSYEVPAYDEVFATGVEWNGDEPDWSSVETQCDEAREKAEAA